MTSTSEREILRQIPAVDQLLQQPRAAEWVRRTSRPFVVAEIQETLNEVRSAIRSEGSAASVDRDVLDSALDERLQLKLHPALRPVINATGVVLHTNLGRAPLSRAAQESLSAASVHYTNLEFSLESGTRSRRDVLVEPALRELLGCEAATVVNNTKPAAPTSLPSEILRPAGRLPAATCHVTPGAEQDPVRLAFRAAVYFSPTAAGGRSRIRSNSDDVERADDAASRMGNSKRNI